MSRIKLGLVGIGKIARDQHIPVLKEGGAFDLVAAASLHSKVDGVANFASVPEMLAGAPVEAIAICSPPQHHFEAARAALEAGKHVLLEKPPCRTVSELEHLAALAGRRGRTLFQTWHSRFAPGVEPAAEILSLRRARRVAITWKEDVRRWHPGQTWIWQAGGFGIFDPGINALSILTRILPEDVFVTEAALSVPSNCEAPIAADVAFRGSAGAEIAAAFDFRHTGIQTWDIDVATEEGTVTLSAGGSALSVDGKPVALPHADAHAEYRPLYAHFAALIRSGRSDVDARPFRLVADAFLTGRRIAVEAFHE